MKQEEIEPYWTKVAKDQLEGRTIKEVRYLTEEEMENIGWDSRCVVMILDNGNVVFPSSDDEGNSAGSLFTMDKENPTLPVI